MGIKFDPFEGRIKQVGVTEQELAAELQQQRGEIQASLSQELQAAVQRVEGTASVATTAEATLPLASTGPVPVTLADESFLGANTSIKGLLGTVYGTLSRAADGSYSFISDHTYDVAIVLAAGTLFAAAAIGSVELSPQAANRLRKELAQNGLEKYIGSNQVYPLVVDREGRTILGFNAAENTLVGVGLVDTLNVQFLVERRVLGELLLNSYTGSGPVYPLVVDRLNRLLLGFDASTESLVGPGAAKIVNEDTIEQASRERVLAPLSTSEYTGAGPIYPFVIDRNNRVLLGFDVSSESLVGPGFAGLPAATVAAEPADDVPLVDPPIAAQVNHILFYGQSLSVGAAAGSVISTAQPYSNITFNGGPRAWTGTAWDFTAFKPLVEDAVSPAPDGGTNRRETCCSGAANYATTLAATENGLAPSEHVILSSTAGHGGYRIDQLEKGTSWYNNFVAHVSGAKTLNADYAVHAFAWVQGENDSYFNAQTTYATYRQKLQQLQVDAETDFKAITGQTSPVYCLTYQTVASAATWKDVCLAQLDLAKTNSKFHLATPIYHLPHAGDAVHLTAIGYKWLGAYFGRAYKQLVIDRVKPHWLKPLSATRRGNVIRVRFDVPQPPLALDVQTLAETTDYGFKVLDGSSAVPISSVTAESNEVVIVLGSTPTDAVAVRYGLDYLGSGLNISGGASGNLRDSDSSTIEIAGVPRPLYNVCPHFELTAITLGE